MHVMLRGKLADKHCEAGGAVRVFAFGLLRTLRGSSNIQRCSADLEQ
jgi:hypothetical protein